jgi:hypothetical protein
MGLPSAPPPAEFSADHTAQARRCRTRGARPCPRLREYARLKGTPNQRRQGHRRLSLAADASAASGYVCPVHDAAEPLVVGVVVAPEDVPADHAGLLLMAGVVSAVQREVPQGRELGLYAV